jgi:hypothetical protein
MNNFNFVSNGFSFDEDFPTNKGKRKHGNLYTQGLTVSLVFGF